MAIRLPLRRNQFALWGTYFSSFTGLAWTALARGSELGNCFSFLELEFSLECSEIPETEGALLQSVTELCHEPSLIRHVGMLQKRLLKVLLPQVPLQFDEILHCFPEEQKAAPNVWQQQHKDECEKWSRKKRSKIYGGRKLEWRKREEQFIREDINKVVSDQYHVGGEFIQASSLEIWLGLGFRGEGRSNYWRRLLFLQFTWKAD